MKSMSVLVLGMMASSLVVAQTEGGSTTFDKLDVDGDSNISVYEAEANTQLLEMFSQLDANGNGLLSRDEFAAIHQQQ